MLSLLYETLAFLGVLTLLQECPNSLTVTGKGCTDDFVDCFVVVENSDKSLVRRLFSKLPQRFILANVDPAPGLHQFFDHVEVLLLDCVPKARPCVCLALDQLATVVLVRVDNPAALLVLNARISS